MRQWYCNIQGQQYGPVDENTLRQWIAEGRVKPSDLVWSEGMASWAPAGSIPGLCNPSVSPPPPPQVCMVPIPPLGGTGGQTPNDYLTAIALQKLSGRWGLPIGFSLLLGLMEGILGALPGVGGIVSLVLSGPLTLGGIIFFLTFTRGGMPQIGQMFDGFKNFGNAVAAYLLVGIFVFLWTLLLIVPGIIAGLSYALTFYLLADDKNLDALAAIKKSKEMMEGHKWQLFCLHLRFLGWSLVCILTLGIGFLWLMPYIATTLATFYEDLRPPLQTAAANP